MMGGVSSPGRKFADLVAYTRLKKPSGPIEKELTGEVEVIGKILPYAKMGGTSTKPGRTFTGRKEGQQIDERRYAKSNHRPLPTRVLEPHPERVLTSSQQKEVTK